MNFKETGVSVGLLFIDRACNAALLGAPLTTLQQRNVICFIYVVFHT